MMSRKLLLLATAGLLWAGSAQADLPVIDFASIAQAISAGSQRVEVINNQIAQIVRLESTVNAVAHGDIGAMASLGSQLGSMGVMNPLGTSSTQMVSALQGLSRLSSDFQRTSALAQGALSPGQFYAPSSADYRGNILNTAAAQLSMLRQASEASLTNTQNQLQQLQSLRASLSSRSTDIAGAAQANARLTGELTTLVAQGNQLAALALHGAAQQRMNDQAEAQAWRCWAEVLATDSQAASMSARAGTVQFINFSTTGEKCRAAGTSTDAPVIAGLTDTLGTFGADPGTGITTVSMTVPIGSGDGSILNTMTNQTWGQQAADNATALGVNPTALAATCVLESNCRMNVGGAGTISGAFQMTNGAYNQSAAEIAASNPALAAQMSGKTDATSMALASAQYMRDGATALQTSGVSNPTVLDVRSFYQFGPTNAASVANAPDGQLMVNVLSGLPQSAYAGNNISASTTVGAWRATVINRIGAPVASQPVLIGA